MNPVIVPGPPVPMPSLHNPPAPPNFNGQWTGHLGGDTPGYCVLELELDAGRIIGTAYLYPLDPQVVPAAVRLDFDPFLGTRHFFNLPVKAFAPAFGQVLNEERMAILYPQSGISPTVNATMTWNYNTVHISFAGSMAKGDGILTLANSIPNRIPPTQMSWEQFRNWILDWPDKDRFVFRGQSQPWSLRTSFHRSNKKNLDNYTTKLVNETYRAVVNKLGHRLDLNDPADRMSFYSILQHYGYPTPLLDWSTSPWVAAYFAFENAKIANNTSVRIFMLDRTGWLDLNQQHLLTMTSPHFSFVEIIPRGNDRADPQCSVFAITTVDDIEAHIAATQGYTGKQYIWAIDIATVERDKALTALEGMGWNRSRLFPDLEGFCRSMRIKHFGAD